MRESVSMRSGGALPLVLTRGVSAFGGVLMAFAIDVWIFRRTGSYPTFAMLALLTFLPNLVLAPFTGMLVDRCDKKHVLVGCELASLATTLFALAAYRRDALGIGAAAVVILSQSVVAHVRWTAMGVTISLLTSSATRAGINGVQQSIAGVLDTCAPILGALALAGGGVAGILAFALLGSAIGLAGLWTIDGRRLRPATLAAPREANLWREATFGLRWIAGQPMLARLLLFIMAYNLAGAVFSVTFTPYLLSHAPVAVLGVASALEGGSALLVGFALLYVGQRVQPIVQVVGSAFVFGLAMIAWGCVHGAVALCALAFCCGCLTSLIVASLQTVWQDNVPVEIQGRVFAARRMVSFLLVPLAVLASVPLSQHVFAPFLQSSAHAASVWGDGQGGALGMMLSTLGIGLAAGSAWFARRNGIRARSAAARLTP
jgi:DHA3 family macrolide efflux protein-like MFS transporter